MITSLTGPETGCLTTRPARARRTSARGRQWPRRRAMGRRGFTVAEVMTAVVVLSVGVLGLAGTATMVSRLLGQGDLQTASSVLAGRRFELLRATRCASVASGTATTGGFSESWTVVGAVGSAQMRLYDVSDAVSYKARNGSRSYTYRSVIQCLP